MKDPFQEVTGFQGGDLEAKYKKLDSSYQKSEARAADVRKRIGAVESTAGAMSTLTQPSTGPVPQPTLILSAPPSPSERNRSRSTC